MEAKLEKLIMSMESLREEVASLRQENAHLQEQVQELIKPEEGAAGVLDFPQMPVLPREELGPGEENPVPRALTKVKIPLPERFEGDAKLFGVFLAQVKLHFMARPAEFALDREKVIFIAGNLGGEALNWVSPLVERQDPILGNYKLFLQEFRRLFERKYSIQARRTEFLTIRQGNRDLVSYISHFTRLAAELQWPVDAQISIFQMGLREELKDFLLQVFPVPESITELIELVVKLDQRLDERKGERRKLEFRRSFNPFKVGEGKEVRAGQKIENTVKVEKKKEFRNPLSPEERERRRRDKLCMFCGQPGHFVRDCPQSKLGIQESKTGGTVNLVSQSQEDGEKDSPVTENGKVQSQVVGQL